MCVVSQRSNRSAVACESLQHEFFAQLCCFVCLQGVCYCFSQFLCCQSFIILHCHMLKNDITKEVTITIQLSAQTSITSSIPKAKKNMKCPLPKLMMLKYCKVMYIWKKGIMLTVFYKENYCLTRWLTARICMKTFNVMLLFVWSV